MISRLDADPELILPSCGTSAFCPPYHAELQPHRAASTRCKLNQHAVAVS